MESLFNFCSKMRNIATPNGSFSIEEARSVVSCINSYLYTNYPGIGYTTELGKEFEFLSDFHKFWKTHHKEILACSINEEKCARMAKILHDVYIETDGSAFYEIYNTCGLDRESICRVRFLTANQDFRGSLDFAKLADIYISDNSIFDEQIVFNDPDEFIRKIRLTSQSQNDKRSNYAKKISQFLIEKNCEPHQLIDVYHNDIYALRQALISCEGAGYGNKKTDMFLRDMVLHKVWNNVRGFEKIDVASDINTIKVALRTGILESKIPLVSSFLDIFCYQYTYIERMNALAWRKVWEHWNTTYPSECIESPCLIDYFVYNVIGKQFCNTILCEFMCLTHGHKFKWHSSRKKTCQICFSKERKKHAAKLLRKIMPCEDPEGHIAITNTKYVRSLPDDKKIKECPFTSVCNANKHLQPPKSISILGQTGWTTAYTHSENGGGGLMS
ncbi:MAG: hypothetical protein IJN29_14895 [Akkermansia sp.]|nr:hypothetical protein [Akkermansia sp.]